MLFGKKKNQAGPAGADPPEEAALDGGAADARDAEDEDIRGGPRPIDPDQMPWGPDGPPWDAPPDVPVQRTGVGQEAAPADEGDSPEDLAAGMSRPEPEEPEEEPGAADLGGGPGRKDRKARPGRERRPKKDRAARGPGPGGIAAAWSGMGEERRQTLFTCGCVTAAFCLTLLVVCGTVLALRTFRLTPSPALARQPSPSGDIYYDQAGNMHVNVHITRQPDTELTVYVYPDGSVSTEKPPEGSSQGVRTVVLYVDSEGNVSDRPPEKPSEPDPPAQEWPMTAELYMDAKGAISETEPEGYWRKVVVAVNEDGTVEVTDGGSHGLDPGSDAASHMVKAELYVGQDGHIHTSDPGGGDRYTVSVGGDGEVSIAPGGEESPGTIGNENPPTGAGAGPYDGMTEQEILAEAERRRKDGGGWYLDTDEVYIVQRGDTLGYLSGRFGFSVDFLASYNGIRDRNLIITGEALRYPSLAGGD